MRLRALAICTVIMLLLGLVFPHPSTIPNWALAETSEVTQQPQETPPPSNEPGPTQEPELSVPPEQTSTPEPTAVSEPTAAPETALPAEATPPAASEEPTPTITPEITPDPIENATEGYASVLANESPVYEKANKDSNKIALLSKDDIVYISDRIIKDADNPEYDWLACHFDSEQGVIDGYMRFKQIRFFTEPETQAFLKATEQTDEYADFEGHPLKRIDCTFIDESPEVQPDPTVEPEITPSAEPTVEPTAVATVEPTVEPTKEPAPTLAPVTLITLDISEAAMAAGDKRTVYTKVEPSDAADPSIVWSTSNEAVALVDAAGNVTAVSAGSVVITATAGDSSGIFAQCFITVYPPITLLTVSGPNRMQAGKPYVLTALDNETPIANVLVAWSSSDETVATVDASGTVIGVMIGSAVITATVQGSSEWKFEIPVEIIRATVITITDSNKEFSKAVSQSNSTMQPQSMMRSNTASEFGLMRLILKTDGTMPMVDEFNPDIIIGNKDNRYIIQFTSVEETEAAFDALKNFSYIKYVAPDSVKTVSEKGTALSSYTYHSWGATAMHADIASSGLASTSGTVYVAILDTGIAPHSFIQDRLWYFYDYVDSDVYPDDENGHGTHVAGTIVDMTQGLDVRVVAYRVLNEYGSGYDSDIINAIYDAADDGSDVINMSLGGYYSSYGYYLYSTAISYATQRGVVVVCAAGNDSSNTSSYIPACITSAGCVVTASVDSDLGRSYFSNYGSSVDVTAPGGSITSCDYTGGFVTMSGTSMAAPHISAACAMIKLSHPSYTASQIETSLKNLCTDLGAAGYDTNYGYGIPNLTSLGVVPKPDLGPSIIQYGSNLMVGQQVFLDSGVINFKDVASDAFNVKWEINNVLQSTGSHNGVPGYSTVLDGNSQLYWTPAAAGYYEITFTVDCDNAISEENESNNETSVMVYVNPAPLPPPQSISISHAGLTIGVGQGSSVLTATVLPAGSNKSVIWSSTNPRVATVSSTGFITGTGVGSAMIRATTVNGLYRDCIVNVVKAGKGVIGISLSKGSAAIDEGKSLRLTVKFTPSSPSYKAIVWSSSNPSVASVNASGTVFGATPGTAVITAVATSGVKAQCTITVNSLAVSQVNLSKTNLEVDEGKGTSLKASVLPKNARFKTVTWSSSNPSIAIVSAAGKITTFKPGTVSITATAHNGVSASCTLVVRSLAVSQVILSKTYLEVDEGKRTSLKASVLPKNARFKTVAWSSSDPSVAAVSAAGKITTFKPGTVQITATAHNGVSTSCTLVVRSLAVSRIALTKAEHAMNPGGTFTLKAALLPTNARYKAVTWVSSNPAVATVTTSGKIKAVGSGTTIISAIAHNGLAVSCTIIVP